MGFCRTENTLSTQKDFLIDLALVLNLKLEFKFNRLPIPLDLGAVYVDSSLGPASLPAAFQQTV